MRQKISATIHEDLISKINDIMSKNRLFRSRSHVIEEALRNYLEDEDD
jgi:metal-responsive CopG/Arc/MetJ family transcriptional regulator